MNRKQLGVMEQLEKREVFSATFWIDPIRGDDRNDGLTAETALQSVARIVSQYDSLKGADHIELQPGDSVIFMPGDHHFAYRYGEGEWRGVFLRGVNGTADEPIILRGLPGARIDNRSPAGLEMSSISILQSSHIVLEGLDVTSFGSAVSIAESKNIVVRDSYIHNVDGIAANNLSGVYLVGVDNVTVQNNLFVDNYDRKNTGNVNNRHIVVFGSSNVSVLGNTMYNQDPNAGMAVDYKHLGGLGPNSTGTYEVAYNTIINSAGIAIGTAAPNSYIHHNLLVDSGAIYVADLGGVSQLANERIEYNTIVNGIDRLNAGGLSYYPTEYAGYPLGPVRWAHNLVVDKRDYDHTEKSTIVVDRYGTDDSLTRLRSSDLLFADHNVYQVANEARFDFYGANGGAYGEQGSDFDFLGWQANGYDRNSATSIVSIDAFYRDLSNSSANAGIHASSLPKLTAFISNREVSETGENSNTVLRLVRSGTDLSERLDVWVTVSHPEEIEVPSLITFAAGEATAEVAVKGRGDRNQDPTQAIQLRLSGQGLMDAVAWLRLHDSPAVEENPRPTDPKDVGAVDGVFRVPGSPGERIHLQSTVLQRWAAYENEMGIAYVDDEKGRVGGVLPYAPGWTEALLSRSQHQVVLPSGVKFGDLGQSEMIAGKYFVFYLVQNNTTSQWLRSNPANDINSINPVVFTSITSSNPDSFDHVRERTENNVVELAWEDLSYGGDQNFTDLVVRNEFVVSPEHCQNRDDKLSDDRQEQEVVSRKLTNILEPMDVNQDGKVTPLDALLVVNSLLVYGETSLDRLSLESLGGLAMIDVNADKHLTFVDVLLVFGRLLENWSENEK